MKKIVYLLFLIVTVFTLCFVAFSQEEQDTAENVVAVELSEEDVQYIAEAYFEVFKKVMDVDWHVIKSSKYLSVDFANFKTIKVDAVIPFLEQYCKDNGFEFLQYSAKELQEKGYVGVVAISSQDAVLKDGKVTISISKMSSSFGGNGGEYTLSKNENGEWVFENGLIWFACG